jgi:type IV pilus assembly protein PilA
MLQRLRHRVQGQEGFTLIELLVVILIIGILAAVAIPTFLSQKTKAYDSNVESAVNSAQTAMETYNTSNGTYPTSVSASASPSSSNNPLVAIEPTLANAFNTGTQDGQDSMQVAYSNGSYTIAAADKKATPVIWFRLQYTPSTGAFVRTCYTAATGGSLIKNEGDCSNTGTWGGQ